jgi:hypothetical protein
MSALNRSDTDERRTILPSGMTWETKSAAIDEVQKWEASGSDNPLDLVAALFRIFSDSVKRKE